jgi:lipid II:glycine glycyltransferase (peptidoglycan interpeptide bridge formation enzyme)
MADLRQSPYWANYMEELGWEVVRLGSKSKEQFLYLRKVPFFGKLLKAPRLEKPLPLSEIDSLAKEEKVFFAKVEPNALKKDLLTKTELGNFNFSLDKWSLHPTKTILIDLRKSEEELLGAMEKDTRYSIRASQRRGIRVVRSKDINRFLKLYQQTAIRKKFFVAEKQLRVLWDIFRNEDKAFILIAQWNKTDIAGCLILHYERTAYYFHAASINKFRELFAPYALVWEAILTSKAMKLKDFDFEGIYDPRIAATKKWRGFSHFKKGFRGEEVELLGSFSKTFNPIAKVIFRLGNFSLI